MKPFKLKPSIFLDFPSFIRFRASLNRFLSPSFFTHPPFQGTPGSLAGRRDQGSHLRFRRESPPVLRKLHGSSCSIATGHLQVFFPQFLRVFGVKTTKNGCVCYYMAEEITKCKADRICISPLLYANQGQGHPVLIRTSTAAPYTASSSECPAC